MPNIFFTADTHFNHANIIKYCNRPFASLDEMNNTLIKNWNDKVGKKDTVYHLGDFGFGNWMKLNDIRKQLNGKIYLVVGNHDMHTLEMQRLAEPEPFEEVFTALDTIIRNTRFYLLHYSCRVWPRAHHGEIHLFGHSHGRLMPHYRSMDVGVDAHDFKPVSFDKVLTFMAKMPIMPTGEDATNIQLETPTYEDPYIVTPIPTIGFAEEPITYEDPYILGNQGN